MRKIPITSDIYSLLPQSVIRLFTAIINCRRINIGASQPLTIAANAVSIPSKYADFSNFTIDGAGASNNLNTIGGGNDGDVIFCRSANSARDIVFKHGADNLLCNGSVDLTLGTVNDLIMAVYDGGLAKWKCILWTQG